MWWKNQSHLENKKTSQELMFLISTDITMSFFSSPFRSIFSESQRSALIFFTNHFTNPNYSLPFLFFSIYFLSLTFVEFSAWQGGPWKFGNLDHLVKI